MMSTQHKFIGCEVSIEVIGGLGWYQGQVVFINDQKQTITITRVLHNGRPAALNEVTINAGDIKDLKILASQDIKDNCTTSKKSSPIKDCIQLDSIKTEHIKWQSTHPSQPHQESLPNQDTYKIRPISETKCQYHLDNHKFRTVKQKDDADLAHEVQPSTPKPNPCIGDVYSYSSHTSFYKDQSSDFDYRRGNDYQRLNTMPPSSYDYSSPRRLDKNDIGRNSNKKERLRRRDETTFGTPVDDDMLTTEFDFEKNLALFDKQAVFEEIQNLKPDVIRQADRFTEKKYKCDENVLPSKAPPKRQIIVPTADAAEVIYANDSGLLVPSVSRELRAALLSTANQHGLTNSRQLEIMGRGATEIILTLSGGSHRLEPANSHQPPVIVVLCGCHMQGAAGVNAARQLESHGVQTIVVTPQLPTSPPPPLLLTHELQLYNLTNGRTTTDPRGITATFDLIVDARLDHYGRIGDSKLGQSWLNSTSKWVSNFRTPVLALDPPSDLAAIPATQPPLPARVLLCPALPLAYTPGRGRVYLLNLPIPQQTYNAVGIKYVSPFGTKLVIPLHPYE
ncbi:enhancer of mRNA-decapping protein 3 [Macrobrachium rosenbergii]|uniref:enhancer of mRNA-decapping protein 3 n=1 Tax=Macrobrachium rosenbergii TaxID=79674 RepID=UPI0034D60361